VEIYLPIAEQSMNVFVLLGLGAAAGLLAGMFGVGGGFLATPLLIFVGIPPAVAVASQANQVIANSVSSLQVQWRRGNVDFRMGLILLLGGLFGSTAGVWLFTYLKRIGQVDFVIAVAYVVMLSTIGVLMLAESLRTYVRRRRNPQAPRGKLHTHYLVHRLPLKLRFYKSKLYISALLPIGIGFIIGVLSAILGVGGGFVLVPAMIYILGMPTAVVIGTSNFQILFVAANVTFLQAATNGTVDIVLALLLILGGVVGAPIGSRLAAKLLPGRQHAVLASGARQRAQLRFELVDPLLGERGLHAQRFGLGIDLLELGIQPITLVPRGAPVPPENDREQRQQEGRGDKRPRAPRTRPPRRAPLERVRGRYLPLFGSHGQKPSTPATRDQSLRPARICYSRAVERGLLARFFDRVTRQAFGDLALDDPPAARYLADLLTRFARTEALYPVQTSAKRRLETVGDSLLEIQRIWDWESPEFNPDAERTLRRHIGDYTLFMTGIFRDHIERLSAVGYYQHEGRRAYRFVAELARASDQPEASLFSRLSERFDLYAGSLTYARKVYFRANAVSAEAWPADPFFRALLAE